MKKNLPLLCAAMFAATTAVTQAVETEPAAYLGVITSPVDAVLSHQLGLSAGTGLVVDYIAPESAAAGTLEQHDIVTQFEDQILISQHQLAVLVRSKKPGDEVKLTVFRKGKEDVVSVALQEKELPPIHSVDWGNFELKIDPFGESRKHGSVDAEAIKEAVQQALRQAELGGADVKEQLDQLNKQMNQKMQQRQGQHFFFGIPGGGGKAEIEIQPGVASSISTTVMVDGDRTITITDKNGDRHLTVKGADGEVEFDGPVNTDEQRAEVPDDVKPMLDSFKVEGLKVEKQAL